MRKFRLPFVLVALLLTSSVWMAAADYVLLVSPPSGVDDTVALQGALDQCVQEHPTGCTVQLGAGTYKTKQLFAANFHGALKGKGIDVTVIDALPDMHVGYNAFMLDWFVYNPPSADNPWPALISFVSSDIAVSDMTLRVTEYEPVSAWWPGDNRCLDALLVITGHSSNASVERVAFDGAPGTLNLGPGMSTNLSVGVLYMGMPPTYPWLIGTLRVVRSQARNVAQAVGVNWARDGQITIGGSPDRANTFEATAVGVYAIDLDNSLVEVSHNNIKSAGAAFGGVFLAQSYFPFPVQTLSKFLVSQNTIEAVGGYEDGIWVIDQGPPLGFGRTGEFVISGNTIKVDSSEAGPAYAGIESDFTVGTVMTNNLIKGNALWGIAAEGDSQCMILGTNVQQVSPSDHPVGLLTNHWFDPNAFPASYCTVVGSNAKANVYDEGVHNVITGLNKWGGNPMGQAIKDAMKRKHEMLNRYFNPH